MITNVMCTQLFNTEQFKQSLINTQTHTNTYCSVLIACPAWRIMENVKETHGPSRRNSLDKWFMWFSETDWRSYFGVHFKLYLNFTLQVRIECQQNNFRSTRCSLAVKSCCLTAPMIFLRSVFCTENFIFYIKYVIFHKYNARNALNNWFVYK